MASSSSARAAVAWTTPHRWRRARVERSPSRWSLSRLGTRGGGMDHAASLASREGCASLIEFVPLAVHHIPIPAGWAFLVANSLHASEKSGAVRERYNAVRTAGTEALRETGFASYAEAIQGRTEKELGALAAAKHLPPAFLDRKSV